jgi:hypothetical protein
MQLHRNRAQHFNTRQAFNTIVGKQTNLQPSFVAARLILTTAVMADEESREETLEKWLFLRSEVRSTLRKLQDAQKRLRAIESSEPFLGNIKGILRKVYGKEFEIPEGRRLSRVPREEQVVASPQTSSRRKCLPSPLMGKSGREAETKRRKLKTSSSPGGSRAVTRVTHLCHLSEMSLEMLQEEVATRKRAISRSGEGTPPLGDGEESIGGEN